MLVVQLTDTLLVGASPQVRHVCCRCCHYDVHVTPFQWLTCPTCCYMHVQLAAGIQQAAVLEEAAAAWLTVGCFYACCGLITCMLQNHIKCSACRCCQR